MAYVRTKQIPPSNGNYYRYLVKGERNGSQVNQKVIQYLGPADGPEDTNIYEDDPLNDVPDEYIDDGMYGVDLVQVDTIEGRDIEIWAEPGVDDQQIKRVKSQVELMHYNNKLTDSQLESMKKISVYNSEGRDFSIGDKETQAAGTYNFSKKEMSIYEIEDRDSQSLRGLILHESGHDVYERLKKKSEKQEKEWRKYRDKQSDELYEEMEELRDEGKTDTERYDKLTNAFYNDGPEVKEPEDLMEKSKEDFTGGAYEVYHEYDDVINEEGVTTNYPQKYWDRAGNKDLSRSKRRYARKKAKEENFCEMWSCFERDGKYIPSADDYPKSSDIHQRAKKLDEEDKLDVEE